MAAARARGRVGGRKPGLSIETFRYDAPARTWLLHRDGGESFQATDPEYGKSTIRTSKNFGRVPLTKFDTYQEK